MTGICRFLILIASALLCSCATNVTIDKYRVATSNLQADESVVVIGRRSASDYETEPELIACVGATLATNDNKINVIPESQFADIAYPWFEPRTAPLRVTGLERLLDYPMLNQKIDDLKVRYFVWVDGVTEKTKGGGAISCAFSIGGGGCFGIGTWDKESEYEAVIWDYQERKLVGKISANGSGTSYMPAFVIPIPLIAPVLGDVCKEMGAQLRTFFELET